MKREIEEGLKKQKKTKTNWKLTFVPR